MARKAVDGITIAINLMYCYGTNEINIETLLNFYCYLYERLIELGVAYKYTVCFEINDNTLERLANYYSDIIEYDKDNEQYRLCYSVDLELVVTKYKVDGTFKKIMKEFTLERVAA
ncbi:MAG: hypothetical protein J6A59_14975 [Lachnospiraceae bacterium]|nr:hypothetical protein [Lachnospiraceae bacterium]